VQGVVAGDAGVTISSPAAVLGFVREGRLRAIAIGAPQRSSLLPDVPTLAAADRRAPAAGEEARRIGCSW
jgi:tripartite-type tricarboxylate transporter receptor subunit TctC